MDEQWRKISTKLFEHMAIGGVFLVTFSSCCFFFLSRVNFFFFGSLGPASIHSLKNADFRLLI